MKNHNGKVFKGEEKRGHQAAKCSKARTSLVAFT